MACRGTALLTFTLLLLVSWTTKCSNTAHLLPLLLTTGTVTKETREHQEVLHPISSVAYGTTKYRDWSHFRKNRVTTLGYTGSEEIDLAVCSRTSTCWMAPSGIASMVSINLCLRTMEILNSESMVKTCPSNMMDGWDVGTNSFSAKTHSDGHSLLSESSVRGTVLFMNSSSLKYSGTYVCVWAGVAQSVLCLTTDRAIEVRSPAEAGEIFSLASVSRPALGHTQ
jgi:hypothetical protein